MATTDARDEPPLTGVVLSEGTRVEVHNDFDDSWSKGFTISTAIDGRYRIRRRSDGIELPGTFTDAEVRRERNRSTWWI